MNSKNYTEAMRILNECQVLQSKKSVDYQNANSSVQQADHFRRGIDTIHDIINQKVLRAQSLLESGNNPKNESLEDTYKDIINYCSFAVSYLRKKIPGQNPNHDIFNQTLKIQDIEEKQESPQEMQLRKVPRQEKQVDDVVKTTETNEQRTNELIRKMDAIVVKE